MELTKNGINCTNIKKLFAEIQIPNLRKRLIYQATQPILDKKPHCKRLQQMKKKLNYSPVFLCVSRIHALKFS
jgi:hypothetical protein